MLMSEAVLKEGAPPLLTHLSRATLNQYSYHQEAAVLDVRYSQTSTAQLASVEAVLRLDFDVWSPGGAALLITPAPSRISAIGRHRLSEKGSGCWVTIEHQITQADQVPSGFSITVEKRSDSAVSGPSERNLLTVNGEFVKIGLEELNDAEIQARRMQKRIANRAIMLDRSPTPRTTSHFGRPPSIAEMPTNDLISLSRSGTPPSKGFLPPRPAPITANTEGEPMQKVPIDYAFESLTRLKTLYKETPEVRADASDWTILSYAENNSPIRISKRFVPALSSTLPLYRVERTLPNVSEDQLLRLIQSTSSNVRTTWDDRIASSETIAYYENGSTTSIWIAQGSFPTRSRVAYVASVRAQEDIKPRSPLSSSSGHTSVTYVASASVPLSAFEVDRTQDRAIVAAGRLNQSKLLESAVILEGWVLETTRSSKDDDDDEMEPQSYTKCSLFTCSDLPLMVVGSFGQAALRARLARMFDCLEASSNLLAAGAIPRFPIPSFDFTNVHSSELERSKPSFVKIHPRNATLVASMLSAIIIKVQLPAFEGRPSGSSVSGLDTASLMNGSGISQRSVSVQSVQHTENNLLEASSVPGQHIKAIQAEPSKDIIIAELVLLRDPAISGYDIRTVTTLPSDKILPTDTSFWSKLSPVPFGAQVFPLLGNTKSASRYLLQVSLPTAQFTSPMEHPLSSLSEAPSLPRWYRKLTTEPGIVQLQATPIKAASQPAGRPLAPLKFVFDGAELQLGISQALSVDPSGRLDELAP